MNSNNSEKERVIFHTPPHIIFVILPVLTVIVLWFVYAFLICPLLISPLIDGRCIWVSGLSFLLLIAVLFLDWIKNCLILTNLRVTRQRGIIGKTIMDIGLDHIEDVKVSFGIIGRIFGFGTLEIESAGTLGRIVFSGIPSPRKVKCILQRETQNLKK